MSRCPFEVHEERGLLARQQGGLVVGDLLVPGRESNFEAARVMNHIYFTATLDAAVWGAELAVGHGRGHVYVVEPTGEFEDDPNVTDKRMPGNPTHSFRTREPLRVVRELVDWVGHSPQKLQAMRDGLNVLETAGCGRHRRLSDALNPLWTRDSEPQGVSVVGCLDCSMSSTYTEPFDRRDQVLDELAAICPEFRTVL